MGNSQKLVILFENVLLGFWLSLKSRVLILPNVKLDVFSATNLAFHDFRNQSMKTNLHKYNVYKKQQILGRICYCLTTDVDMSYSMNIGDHNCIHATLLTL